MRILSKKTFALGAGANREGKPFKQTITVRGAIMEIDDALKEDITFKAAVQAGDIVIMDGAKETKAQHLADLPPVSEYAEKVKLMKREEIAKECEKYNAQYSAEDKVSINKARLLEAYKLQFK